MRRSSETEEMYQPIADWVLFREIFHTDYRITCKEAYTYIDEEIEKYGVKTTGNPEWDHSHSLKIVWADLTIASMVAWYVDEKEFNIPHVKDIEHIWDKSLQWLEYLKDFFAPTNHIRVSEQTELDLELMKDMYCLVAFLNHLKRTVMYLKGWDKIKVQRGLGDRGRMFRRPGQEILAGLKGNEPIDVPDIEIEMFLSGKHIHEMKKYLQRTLI